MLTILKYDLLKKVKKDITKEKETIMQKKGLKMKRLGKFCLHLANELIQVYTCPYSAVLSLSQEL